MLIGKANSILQEKKGMMKAILLEVKVSPRITETPFISNKRKGKFFMLPLPYWATAMAVA